MAPWPQHPRVVAVRERSSAADLAVRTLDVYRRQQSGRSAAAIAYYGFLSIFPLLLVLTTILGFVLQGNEELQQKIVDGALSQIPVLGQQITEDPSELTGSVPVLIFGLLTSLWAGQRAFMGMQAALNDIADIDIDARPAIHIARMRALIGVGVVGLTQISAAALQTRIALESSAWPSRVLQLLAVLAVNFAGLAAVFRWMCHRPQSWRAVRPGAALGAAAFTVLQLIGVAVIGRSISRASNVYGTFATVIALLFWLSLHVTITLYGAALNQAVGESSSKPDVAEP
jgi:membrane protein